MSEIVNKKALGDWGEEQAARFLQSKGAKIVERNYKTRFGELDIIAQIDKYIVFVEVKLRKNNHYGYAMEYVDYRKQRKLSVTAEIWLRQNRTRLQPRFDVIEIYAPYGEQTVRPTINHIENAF